MVWKEVGKVGDRYHRYVAISGDGMIVAVGASKNDDNGIDSGHVKVYKWDDGLLNYKQLGGTITGEAAGDIFQKCLSRQMVRLWPSEEDTMMQMAHILAM